MILVDDRTGSVELLPYIKRNNVPTTKLRLDFGDFCMEGNGPKGKISIGVERKTLHDILHCIDDGRYNQQRIGMRETYDMSFLLIEGVWKPSEDGTLYEGFRGGSIFGPCKYRTQRVNYSKLRRYLLSVSLSGVVVIYTRDILQTAYDLCEIYHYFQKRFEAHTSLLSLPELGLPDLRGKPSLCRRWAGELSDIGVKLSLEAERLFGGSAQRLANSSELDWMKIRGVGLETAKRIIKEINKRW